MDLSEIAENLGLGSDGNKKYKTGLALGGGGIQGFVHIGVIQALQEQKIEIDMIAGTSAGALVGAFIADGMTPKEVHELLKSKNIFEYSKFHWPTDGLFKLSGMQEVLKQSIKTDTLEGLEIPYMATVSNLNKGKVEYKTTGKISEVVLASASIPFLFAPVEMDGDKYADGGIFDNLPIKPLLKVCDKVIGVSVSPIEPTDNLDSLMKVAARTFQLSVNAIESDILENCGILIEPTGLGKFGLLDTDRADELFDIGYKHTKNMDIKALLGRN